MLLNWLNRPGHRWALLAVTVSVCIGVAVRLREGYVPPVADAATYVAIASGISPRPVMEVARAAAIDGLAVRGVTYPLLIALGLTLTGGLTAIVWLQSLVLVPATVWMLYLAGRTAFSVRVGVTCAWLYALWIPAQIYTSLLMQETWLSFLMACLLYLLARTLRDASGLNALLLGLLSGVLAVTHLAFEYIGAALIAGLALQAVFIDRIMWRKAALVTVGLLALLVPSVVIRDVADLPAQGQGAVGWGAGGGWTFWQGSNPALNFTRGSNDYQFANQVTAEQFAAVQKAVESGTLNVDPNLGAIIRAKPTGQVLTDGDFYRAGLQNLASDPTAIPIKVANGVRYLSTIPDGIALYRDAPSPAAPGGPWTFFAIVMWAGGVAGILCLIVRRRDRLVMTLPLVVQFAVLIAAYPDNRHAIPLWGSLMLFTAVFARYAVPAARRVTSVQRDLSGVIKGAAVLAVALLLTAGARAWAQGAPSSLQTPRTATAALKDRDSLRQIIFGSSVLPKPEVTWEPASSPVALPGTESVNAASVPLRFGLTSELTEYIPSDPSGCGLILQSGHASWVAGGGGQVAEQAVRDGCRVITIDMPAQGVNADQFATLPDGNRIAIRAPDSLHGVMATLAPNGNALDTFFTPVVAAVDRLAATTDQPPLMAGLSGGGWTTSVAAALDPRITKSLAVAGSTTVDPDQPCGGDYEQCLPALYSRISMEQIYALAAIGEGRKHVQVLNYYDPCCFAGSQGLWSADVDASVAAVGMGGEYQFIADRTQPGQHAFPAQSLDLLHQWQTGQ